MHENAKVKRAINTLDHPLWIPSVAYNPSDIIESNYKLETHSKSVHVPKSKDIDILNRLLYTAQKRRTHILKFHSMAVLTNELGYTKTKKNYDSIWESVVKWGRVYLRFPQTERYTKFWDYRVIEGWSFDPMPISGKSHYVEIHFSKDFYDLNNSSSYAVHLPIKAMEELKPYSKRLYEILAKSFYKRVYYNIGTKKLVSKMGYPFAEIQPIYEFNRIIREGVKEIKRLNLLNISVKRGGEVFYFQKREL